MAENQKPQATIKTLGDAFVITAGFKFETIKNLKKYGMESALVLVNDETKDPYFCVSHGHEAEASKYGVVFTGANASGYAECTGSFPEIAMSDEKKREYLKDHFAFVIANLNKVQAPIEAAEKELDKVMATVNAAIVTA